MSYQTLYQLVSINKDKLLDLFLGKGDLLLVLYGQMPITINDFSDRHGIREVDGVLIHEAKIRGRSKDPNLSYVDGKVTITPIQDCKTYKCMFELHLQDHCE